MQTSHAKQILKRSRRFAEDVRRRFRSSVCRDHESQDQSWQAQDRTWVERTDIPPEFCLGVLCMRHPDKAELLSRLVADNEAWRRLQRMANEAFGRVSLDRCLQCSRAYPLCCVIQTEHHTPYRSRTKLASTFNLPITIDDLVQMAEQVLNSPASDQTINPDKECQ